MAMSQVSNLNKMPAACHKIEASPSSLLVLSREYGNICYVLSREYGNILYNDYTGIILLIPLPTSRKFRRHPR